MAVYIQVGTAAAAMRAKRLLEQQGVRGYVRRSTGEDGCGYSVLVPSYSPEISTILKNGGIVILGIKGRALP